MFATPQLQNALNYSSCNYRFNYTKLQAESVKMIWEIKCGKKVAAAKSVVTGMKTTTSETCCLRICQVTSPSMFPQLIARVVRPIHARNIGDAISARKRCLHAKSALNVARNDPRPKMSTNQTISFRSSSWSSSVMRAVTSANILIVSSKGNSMTMLCLVYSLIKFLNSLLDS